METKINKQFKVYFILWVMKDEDFGRLFRIEWKSLAEIKKDIFKEIKIKKNDKKNKTKK